MRSVGLERNVLDFSPSAIEQLEQLQDIRLPFPSIGLQDVERLTQPQGPSGILGPDVAQGMGLPFWAGLIPQSNLQGRPKLESPILFSTHEHTFKVNQLQFVDFQGGGDKAVTFYSGGDRTLYMAPIGTLGTDKIDVLDLEVAGLYLTGETFGGSGPVCNIFGALPG